MPRVKKFISVKLRDGLGKPQPMLISPQCEGAGLFLWAMAQSSKLMMQVGRTSRPGGRQDQRGGYSRILFPEDFTERLGVGIAEFHPSRHQHLFNYGELNAFSNYVDYLIQNEAVSFCQATPDLDPMQCIKRFTDLYDFSENDLSDQALRQAYLRFRKGVGAHFFDVKITRQVHFMPIAAMAA